MKLGVLVFIFMVVCLNLLHAQQAILPAGAEAVGSGGYASFSLGQIDYVAISGQGFSLDQGVQQAYEVSEVLSINESENEVQLNIYPIPANDFIRLDFELTSMISGVDCLIYDITGNIIFNSPVVLNTMQINCEKWPAGQYVIRITDYKSILCVHKLIKS